MLSGSASFGAMTSRTLFLMRHAKTRDHHPLGDKARELSPRGVTQAQQAGLELASRGIQLVLCSTSVRTRQTCALLGLRTPEGEPVPVQYMEALYHAGADTLRQRISEIEDEVTGLLIVGHAPAIPTLASELAWTSSHQAADQMQCSFPTSTFSEFVIDDSWASFADGIPEAVELSGINRPKK